MTRSIVWFRGKDLRISDHAPLVEAAAAGEVIPLFVLDPYFFAPDRAAELPSRMQFLLDSLTALAANLEHCGSRLVVVAGRSTRCVPALAAHWQADRVFAHRWSEPFARRRDRIVEERLRAADCSMTLFEGETLRPPGTLRTGAGKPYAVFTQFARKFSATTDVARPLPAPLSLPPLPNGLDLPPGLETRPIPALSDLGLRRNPAVQSGGERAARERLQRFVEEAAHAYPTQRNRMDRAGTSRLSADLKFGTLSVRTVWAAIESATGGTQAEQAFLNQLVWRDFAHSTLYDRPELLDEPFRPGFVGFPWRWNPEHWEAWTTGRTGYPVVDAAARQLLGEGFVHNRARMIAASFLTKHLLIDYRRGEAHYMRHLTDGDWAQNNLGWQWSAGCGCDAQPYFRVFNPMSQGEQHDPDGDYVRRFVPELACMPKRWIHRPWEAPEEVLRVAGVELGSTYPDPIVDHRTARQTFLDIAGPYLKSKRSPLPGT